MSSEASQIYTFLEQRRSASTLIEPAPHDEDIRKILAVAGTVPDHGSLKPYRFVVISGTAREKFGEALVDSANTHRGKPLDEHAIPKIKAKAFAAPMQILLVASPVPSEKVPLWEQTASAACTGYAIDLAANSLGYGAVWKSFAYDPGPQMKTLLQLKDHEKFLGWINIGTEKRPESGKRSSFDVKKHALFLK